MRDAYKNQRINLNLQVMRIASMYVLKYKMKSIVDKQKQIIIKVSSIMGLIGTLCNHISQETFCHLKRSNNHPAQLSNYYLCSQKISTYLTTIKFENIVFQTSSFGDRVTVYSSL